MLIYKGGLVCPHSRVIPAVFVPACVAMMVFPICQGWIAKSRTRLEESPDGQNRKTIHF